MMERILKLFCCACAAFVLAGGAYAQAGKAAKKTGKRPNVVIYITDDESWLERSIYGWNTMKTPNIDRVAKQGVLFNKGYSSAPSCAPARASLLTGRNFWELEEGAYIQAWLPRKFKRLPEIMGEHGYRSGYTGKGWGPGVKPPEGEEETPAGKMYNSKKRKVYAKEVSDIDYAANFKEFLEEGSGEPYVFWVGSLEPHGPYNAKNHERLDRERDFPEDKVPMPGYMPDTEKLRRFRANFLYEVCLADDDLGRIIKVLEDRGELENTLLIVTADNGTAQMHSKGTPYDWGVHVPLAIMWLGEMKGGRVVDDFVSFPDIAPTILEAANIKVPSEMSGRSFMNILKSDKSGQVDPTRTFVVTGLEWHGEISPLNRSARAIRTAKYEYIVNYARRPINTSSPLLKKPIPTTVKPGEVWEEFFDLSKDPWELDNLIDSPEYAKEIAQIKKQLHDYQMKTKDPRVTGDMDTFNKTREFVETRKKADYK